MTSHASLSTPRVQNGTLYFVALLREDLGQRIATARQGAGLTQQQLALAIGLKHAQDVSRYERGKVEVPSSRIDLIAEATSRPRSFFTRDPGEPEPADPDRIEKLERDLQETQQALAVLPEVQAALARIEALLLADEAVSQSR